MRDGSSEIFNSLGIHRIPKKMLRARQYADNSLRTRSNLKFLDLLRSILYSKQRQDCHKDEGDGYHGQTEYCK